jgi:hypothetical protein
LTNISKGIKKKQRRRSWSDELPVLRSLQGIDARRLARWCPWQHGELYTVKLEAAMGLINL